MTVQKNIITFIQQEFILLEQKCQ